MLPRSQDFSQGSKTEAASKRLGRGCKPRPASVSINTTKEMYMDTEINLLKTLFTARYSLSQDVDDEILSIMDKIFYLLNNLDVNEFRQKSTDLSYQLHQIGSKSIPYLIFLFSRKLEAVSYQPTYKGKEINPVFDDNKFTQYFKDCLESCDKQGKGFRLLDFEIPSLDAINEQSIYCGARSMLDQFASIPIDQTDILPRMFLFSISRRLSIKFNCQNEFYIQFSSFLERLNRDGYFQMARDFAEESLLCSYENKEKYYGHYVRFSIYTSQMNIVDSLINGCSLLTSLSLEEKVCASLMEKTYLESFFMYRNFRFFEFAKNIYDTFLKNIKLDSYHKQQCDMAMFYLLLLSEDSTLLSKSNLYVKNNEDEILKFKGASLIPWLTLISNLKVFYPKDYEYATYLNNLERKIENELDGSEVKSIKDRILKGRTGGKEELIKGLINLSRTRNKADLIHEVNQLIVTANRVIETSLLEGDVEGVLLGHQLKSDGSIAFNSSTIIPKSGLMSPTFDMDENNAERFNSYINYVKDSLSSMTHIQYIWIGSQNDKVYCVIYENQDFKFCGYISSCTTLSIKNWLNDKLCNLAFIDNPNTGSIFITKEDYWKEESNNILNNLPNIDMPLSRSEIVLFTDVELSLYPYNLIKSNRNIVSSSQSLTSPLSFDNYLKYESDLISLNEIYAWAPIIENDMAISMAYAKLKEQLRGFKVTYTEDLKPNNDKNKDINIFISHGGRDKTSGFKGLYPSDGKVYVDDQMFGKGKVAILFICHSGSIVKNYYSNSVHSFTKKLLSDGYQAVIAPSWSLNVSIPGIWSNELLINLNNGLNLSESVHRANQHVKSIFIVESAWAAMHVFGNGSLKCALQNSQVVTLAVS